ncbi:putative tRNA (cytosine(34)-C(5))-methyltransferase-like isoform X2 [Capsicum annuum]|nr:putative tRNA (cytosine(34)-C(5))-methyltransferase-like isoform X2 [Capsicum annuum]
MGGRGRSRTQRKHFRHNRENVWKRSKHDDADQTDSVVTTNDVSNKEQQPSKKHWEPFATQNLAFDEYYKEQGIVPTEEWDTFIGSLRTPLPAAFRINSSTQCYEDIRTKLENDFMKSIQAEGVDGSEIEGIKPLPWYPENLAWQSNFSRNQLRKNQVLERFHEFLKLQNEIGNITRQEAVSMVPPLFLDVRPDHFALDMCAAPGSKTFQLLEMIHHLAEPGTLPSGMVLANDVDVQRCNLLIHQTKRMSTANLIVTNHEAQHFPSCRLDRNCANGSETQKVSELDINQLQFDRVLCDVPCSGDGTLRKAPDIWRKWNAGNGNGLHGLQIQIAMRGLSLLKVGGRMVYSTCSMNPIENEAVVAEVLRRCGASVELVDVSSELPQLVRRPGLKKWKVRDKGAWWTSYKDVPECRRNAIVPGMFPSGNNYVDASEKNDDATRDQLSDSGNNGNGIAALENPTAAAAISDEEVSTLPLERCMRIVPHDQNSGAFFISVFQKLSPLPAAAFQQKKPVSSRGKSSSSDVKVKEDVNVEDVKPLDSVGSQEATMDDADIQAESVTTKVKEDENPEDVKPVDSVGSQDATMDDADIQAESVTTKVKEDENTEDVKPVDSVGSQDATMDDAGNGTDETALNTEPSDILEKADKEETQPSTDIRAEPETALNTEPSGILEKADKVETQPSTDLRAEPETARGKRKLQMQGKWRGVDPVIFYKEEAVVGKIKHFYGIKESFLFEGHLITRNSDMNHVKRIYYVSKSVKEVLHLNFLAGQQLKIASVGLKMFERQTSKDGASAPCIFRISSEGLPLMLPHITKQILYAFPADFKHLLQYKSIKFGDFVDAEFGEKASQLLMGCCVMVLNKENKTLSEAQADPSTIAIGCWRGRANISVMVTALDCQELLERMSMSVEEETKASSPEIKPSTNKADEIVELVDDEAKENIEQP